MRLAWRAKHPQTKIQRIDESAFPHLKVTQEGRFLKQYLVGSAEHGVTATILQNFLDCIATYRQANPYLFDCFLVYGGDFADQRLIEQADQHRLELKGFHEYQQGLMDFRGYLQQQTAEVGNEKSQYPPSLYVTQRMNYECNGKLHDSQDALADVLRWLQAPQDCFVLVLANFGTGKTFLLRQLAWRLGQTQQPPFPLLISMRELEKGSDLDSLVLQHLGQKNLRQIDLDAFYYMLENGLILLLFDGFDELTLRVGYKNAAVYLDALLHRAGRGKTKMVLSSRTQHFLGRDQIKGRYLEKLGERVEALSNHRLVELADFNEREIREFLQKDGQLRGLSAAQIEARHRLITAIQDLPELSHNPAC